MIDRNGPDREREEGKRKRERERERERRKRNSFRCNKDLLPRPVRDQRNLAKVSALVDHHDTLSVFVRRDFAFFADVEGVTPSARTSWEDSFELGFGRRRAHFSSLSVD